MQVIFEFVVCVTCMDDYYPQGPQQASADVSHVFLVMQLTYIIILSCQCFLPVYCVRTHICTFISHPISTLIWISLYTIPFAFSFCFISKRTFSGPGNVKWQCAGKFILLFFPPFCVTHIAYRGRSAKPQDGQSCPPSWRCCMSVILPY